MIVHGSFVAWVEAEVLPNRAAHPDWHRLDGRRSGGNPAAFGRFLHAGSQWRVHGDTWFAPVLIAYEAVTQQQCDDPFEIGEARNRRCLRLRAKMSSGPKRFYVYEEYDAGSNRSRRHDRPSIPAGEPDPDNSDRSCASGSLDRGRGDDSKRVEWHELADAAEVAFSIWPHHQERKWAERSWAYVAVEGLTEYRNELERNRVLCRLLNLATIYNDFCQIAWDKGRVPDHIDWAEKAGLDSFYAGVLFGLDVEDRSRPGEVSLGSAIRDLSYASRDVLWLALARGWGHERNLFAAMWQTQYREENLATRDKAGRPMIPDPLDMPMSPGSKASDAYQFVIGRFQLD